MKLEPGSEIWLVQNLKFGEGDRPIFVTNAVLNSWYNDTHIGVWGAIYEMGHSAFPTESEANEAALVMQGWRIARMGKLNGKHIHSWNTLLDKTVREFDYMPPGWSTENFAAWEFLCPVVKVQHMNKRFVMRLQLSRTIAGIAYVIGSGWRCEVRNAAVGGLEDSSHLIGLAADIIATTSAERYKIVQACLMAGFTRIGVARYFVHVDSDPGKPPGVMWLYT